MQDYNDDAKEAVGRPRYEPQPSRNVGKTLSWTGGIIILSIIVIAYLAY